MKIFLKYLLRRFGKSFFIAASGFMSLFIFSGLIIRLNVFSEYGASVKQIIYFLSCKSPAWFLQALPISILLALVMTITELKRRNELTAIETSGVSMITLMQPFIAVAFVIAGLMFLTDEFVARVAAKEAYRYYNVVIQKQKAAPPQGRYFNLVYHTKDESGAGKYFYYIGFYDSAKLTGSNFNLDTINEKGAENIFARAFIYKNGWDLRDGFVRTWDSGGELLKEESFKSRVFNFPQTPGDFIIKTVSYREMRFFRLKKHIEELKKAGIPSHQERIDFHSRVSSALSALVVIVIGFPIGIYFSHIGRVFAVALSMVVCFTYWGLYSLGLSFGETGALPPWIGAWGVNIIFVAAGFYFMKKKNV
ncbi:LptF/LptG family permease [bacterium]|nr:LptF/LptG family permease [bacterium]MBU4134514.1 LptF/LptG family permease [bacterium]